MTIPQQSVGLASWAALRQVQALRDSLAGILNGDLYFEAKDGQLRHLDRESLPEFLTLQGFGDNGEKFATSIQQELGPQINVVGAAIQHLRDQRLGKDWVNAAERGQRTTSGSDDFGVQRSGGGWYRTINFCITSALVRLLGAWEQFELDVLKCLFYYRPSGKPFGPPVEQITAQAEESVIREEPKRNDDRLVYEKPAIWTWVRKHAENNIERRKILVAVFGIDTTPGATKDERTKSNKYRDDLYQKRHDIAHGRANVDMTLKEYVEADVFVYRCIDHLAQQGEERQKLLV